MTFFSKEGLVRQVKDATFKDLLKEIIKIIYLFLILSFYIYFCHCDSLSHKKVFEALYIEQLSNQYVDLLLEMSIKILLSG